MNNRVENNDDGDINKNKEIEREDLLESASNHATRNEKSSRATADQNSRVNTLKLNNTADQQKPVDPDQEISHFLKAEANQAPHENKMLDSASVVHGVGHMLRNARVAKEMSVEDVSRHLKISAQQIEAIEKEDFDELPGRTFMRGFVRNYANLMQLDADSIVRLLPGAATNVTHVEHTPFKIQEMTSLSRDSKYLPRALFIFVILVFLGLAGYFLYEKIPFLKKTVDEGASMAVQQNDGQTSVELQLPLSSSDLSDKSDSTNQTQQSSFSSQDSAAVLNTIGTLTFKFSANAHVTVTDGNDDIIFKQNNIRGTQQRISGKKPLSIIISDASAVEVAYNDRIIDTGPYTNAQNGSAQFTLE